MQIEIQTAGDHAASQLKALHSKENGKPDEVSNSVAVTLLKILTIITGIFFAMVSAMSLPPDLAFISITLIAVTVATLVAGSEKIIAIFPRNIWIWRSHYPAPATHHHYETAPAPSYSPRGLYNRFMRKSPAPGRHSVRSTTAGAGRASRPAGSSVAPRRRAQSSSPLPRAAFDTTRHTAVGGGHVDSPYAGGTQNVAVGSRRHDDRTTAPSGQVIPGNRKAKAD